MSSTSVYPSDHGRLPESSEATAIRIEKVLCDALGRKWSAAGPSVDDLATEAVVVIKHLRAERDTWRARAFAMSWKLSGEMSITEL